MRVLGKDKIIYSFCPEQKFAYYVEDGETFWVETEDCYGGRFQNATDLRVESMDTSRFDAAVGPIHISNATQNDTLCVEVLDIQLADHGVMVTAKNLGVLGDKIQVPTTKIIPIKNGFAYFDEHIKIPLNPMIGVMGVLPESGSFRCTVPGCFGGNMDTKELAIGTKAYFPIFQPGCGLALSDLHACMGDGELSGTGLEIAGRVCIKVSILKGINIRCPILESVEAVYMIITEETFEKALYTAASDAASFLQNQLTLDFQDAYRLLSAACDICISQVVNGVYTLKLRIPKYLLRKENRS